MRSLRVVSFVGAPLFALLCAMALPTYAESVKVNPLAAGLWKTSFVSTQDGVAEGEVAGTVCVSGADAMLSSDAEYRIRELAALTKRCQLTPKDVSASTVTFNIRCAFEKGFNGSGLGTYTVKSPLAWSMTYSISGQWGTTAKGARTATITATYSATWSAASCELAR